MESASEPGDLAHDAPLFIRHEGRRRLRRRNRRDRGHGPVSVNQAVRSGGLEDFSSTAGRPRPAFALARGFAISRTAVVPSMVDHSSAPVITLPQGRCMDLPWIRFRISGFPLLAVLGLARVPGAAPFPIRKDAGRRRRGLRSTRRSMAIVERVCHVIRVLGEAPRNLACPPRRSRNLACPPRRSQAERACPVARLSRDGDDAVVVQRRSPLRLRSTTATMFSIAWA